jgi:hypothetical protein
MTLETQDLEALLVYFKILAEIEEENAKIKKTSGGSEG